jgi:antirestriction protein ArdC
MLTNDLYQDITNRITTALEQGIVPWQRPWNIQGEHRNLLSRRAYRGVNQLLLNITSAARGYTSPMWGTFKQISDAGGRVRAGEHGTRIVFWKVLEYADPKPTRKEHDDAESSTRRVPVLRQFVVFNAEQCDLPHGLVPPAEAPREFHADDAAERIWATYTNAPTLRHGGDAAYYRPAMDVIVLPKRTAFKTSAGYYAVLFHEAVHSTGHAKRLNRASLQQAGRFGDQNYSQEELVAELGSAMLQARAGLQPDVPNSAAYIAGWLNALQGDKRLIVIAAQQAEKACAHLTGDTPTPTSASASARGAARDDPVALEVSA